MYLVHSIAFIRSLKVPVTNIVIIYLNYSEWQDLVKVLISDIYLQRLQMLKLRKESYGDFLPFYSNVD
jgi:hypothetical protein